MTDRLKTRKTSRKQTAGGFTLIELLIVIALVSLLASLAIPNVVASRIAANETAAVSNLRKINEAQVLFKMRNLGAGLASPRPMAHATLAELESAKLILWPTNGSYQRNGYTYANILATPDTVSWGVTAFPITLTSGTRDFAITNDGFIRNRSTTGVAITTLAAAQGLFVFK